MQVCNEYVQDWCLEWCNVCEVTGTIPGSERGEDGQTQGWGLDFTPRFAADGIAC